MAVLRSPVFFSTLSVLLGCVVTASIYHCVPGTVGNVSVSREKLLTWSAASNPEKCNISGYVVNVLDSEDGSILQFQTSPDDLTCDFNDYLEMCKSYNVEVHAITDKKVLGPAEAVTLSVPAPANMNLTVDLNHPEIFNNTRIDLSWKINDENIFKCISYYRVVYWDENNVPKDVYVDKNTYTLPATAVACMKYTFQVRAIVGNPDDQGPIAETSWAGYTAEPNPPELITIVTDSTTTNMTWKAPSYAENRCELTYLVVETVGLNTTRVPIKDSPLRPDINVYLTDLQPENVYISHVFLENNVGYSENVTVTFETSEAIK